jgi:hypothetical protein
MTAAVILSMDAAEYREQQQARHHKGRDTRQQKRQGTAHA